MVFNKGGQQKIPYTGKIDYSNEICHTYSSTCLYLLSRVIGGTAVQNVHLREQVSVNDVA